MPTAVKVHRVVSPQPKKRRRPSFMNATLEEGSVPNRKPNSFPVLDAVAELLSYGCRSDMHNLEDGVEQVATGFRFSPSGQRVHLVIAGSDVTEEQVRCLYRIWFLLRTLAHAHPQGKDPEAVLEEQYYRVVREVYTMCYAATFRKLFQKWGKRILLNPDMKRPSIVGDYSTMDKLAKIFIYAERCQNFFLRWDSVDDPGDMDDAHWKAFAVSMNQLTTLTFEVTSAKSVCELWASLCDYHSPPPIRQAIQKLTALHKTINVLINFAMHPVQQVFACDLDIVLVPLNYPCQGQSPIRNLYLWKDANSISPGTSNSNESDDRSSLAGSNYQSKSTLHATQALIEYLEYDRICLSAPPALRYIGLSHPCCNECRDWIAVTLPHLSLISESSSSPVIPGHYSTRSFLECMVWRKVSERRLEFGNQTLAEPITYIPFNNNLIVNPRTKTGKLLSNKLTNFPVRTTLRNYTKNMDKPIYYGCTNENYKLSLANRYFPRRWFTLRSQTRGYVFAKEYIGKTCGRKCQPKKPVEHFIFTKSHKVPLYPPRPQLLNLLGLPYRRVPVLAFGRDLYVDTSLLVNVLERRFPENTLFPKRKDGGSLGTGIQKALVQFYADRGLFSLGFKLLPWLKTPKALQEDRAKLMGRPIDFKKLEDKLEISHSELSSQLEILNEQLSDGREWIFDTVTPGFTDVGIYFVLAWLRTFRKTRPVFDSAQFPHAVAWLDRLDNTLKSKRSANPSLLSKVSGEDAAKEIFSSGFEDLSYVGFDEVEAKRLGLTREMLVAVFPDDTGSDVPTSGKLLALNKTQVVVDVVNPDDSSKSVRVHFPRLGYIIKPLNSDASNLNAKL